MKGLRSTLLLLVVLIGLGGYIYFVDSKKPVGDAEEKEKLFAGVTADAVEEIEIKAEDGSRSVLRKAEGQWRLVEPETADADEAEITTLTSSLPDLDVQRVVDEKATDLKRYGLEPARLEVAFRTSGQKEPRRVLIGDKTPTGSELYAKVPDSPRVVLLSSFLDGTFNKNTFALRDKSALKFERDKVTTLDLSGGKGTFSFAKSGTEWKLVKPIAARGDFGTIEGMVERLNSLRMQSIVAGDAGADLRKYGLDRPTATATVGAGSARATLLLGSTENAVIHAKDASRPLVFTVPPTVVEDLFKPVEELRRKDLFDARSFTATRAEFRRGDQTLTFDKATGKDDKEIWKDAAGKDVDTAKFDDLLNRVTGLRAESFEASAPAALRSPVLTVTFRYDKGTMETVTFGRGGSDVFAGRADEPGAARVAAMAFDEVMTALDAMK